MNTHITYTALYDYVENYSIFRKYKRPTPEQSLLFLVSEVGELAEAYSFRNKLNFMEKLVLWAMYLVGMFADKVVSKQDKWIRNNHRKNVPSVEDEIPDVMMMLSKFSCYYTGQDPIYLMSKKFESKDFDYNTDYVISSVFMGKKNNE